MPLDETVDHPLLAGLVEVHRQLVALDRGDPPVAEFLVEDAFAEREAGAAGDDAFRHQFALDEALLRFRAGEAAVAAHRPFLAAVLLGALPARRRIGVLERVARIEAA